MLAVTFLDEFSRSEGPAFDLAGREGRFEIAIRVPDDCAVMAEAEVIGEETLT